MAAPRRRPQSRTVLLDRAIEPFPLFRLSDSAEDAAVACTTPDGGRWRVLPAPGERLPGTFDQDVFVELIRRLREAGRPADGSPSFTPASPGSPPSPSTGAASPTATSSRCFPRSPATSPAMPA